MNRAIKVTAVPRREPDLRLYVLALIALTHQLAEQERSAGGQPPGGGDAA